MYATSHAATTITVLCAIRSPPPFTRACYQRYTVFVTVCCLRAHVVLCVLHVCHAAAAHCALSYLFGAIPLRAVPTSTVSPLNNTLLVQQLIAVRAAPQRQV